MVKKANIKAYDVGSARAVYIPAKIRGDSAYPFTREEEESLTMEIRRETLVIKLEKK